jgi:hypothetical protein
MGLFYRWRKAAPSDWVAGTATIVSSEPVGEPGPREAAGESILDQQLNYFGYRTYDLTLALQTPVHGAYETTGAFKVPRRAENTGWLASKVQIGLKAGLMLPVHVDPRDRDEVKIDWPAFLADPGRRQEQDGAAQNAYNRKLKEMTEADPKLLAKMRANNELAARTWAEAVRNGVMEREDFEQALDLEIECGRMDPADAAAARASLADPGFPNRS